MDRCVAQTYIDDSSSDRRYGGEQMDHSSILSLLHRTQGQLIDTGSGGIGGKTLPGSVERTSSDWERIELVPESVERVVLDMQYTGCCVCNGLRNYLLLRTFLRVASLDAKTSS
mmetsp:Transcript_28333/g.40082  ORF Transcript_28333/g.40082 Transcript_28333/m.40082 type:complete len:114 (+) Transcript_28333:87-428(+)